MKKTLLIAALLLGLAVNAQDPPKFLIGLSYTVRHDFTENGVPFEYYEVTRDYKKLKGRLINVRKKRVSVNKNGLLFVDRKVDGYTVTTVSGFNFKKAYIYL